jgi:SHS2 domain-containing protein
VPGIPTDADEEPKGTRAAHWRFGTTADVGIGARAGSPEELFAQLGEGLTALITDLSKVRTTDRKEIQVRATTPEGLVVAYLTELIGLFDEEGWLGRSFHVRLSGTPLQELAATVEGEGFTPERHPVHVQAKAIPLHRLELDLRRGRARVLVDI